MNNVIRRLRIPREKTDQNRRIVQVTDRALVQKEHPIDNAGYFVSHPVVFSRVLTK